MKTHTFSIVVGTGACNIECPYCVSKMTDRACRKHDINLRRFDKACRIALMARDGLVNAMFTGTGEPCLYPQDIDLYLRVMGDRFPLITLQTNGTLLTEDKLKEWADKGLTSVCLSVAHVYADCSNKIMGIKGDYDYWETARMIKDAGLMVRLNYTMLKEGVHEPEHVEHIINCAKIDGIEQLTFREVEMVGDSKVQEYVERQKPHGAAKRLHHYLLANNANRLPDLPHGGTVYDYRDQNVCISNCLTGTLDPNDIRQIIFFPSGEISYDWRFKGARIL